MGIFSIFTKKKLEDSLTRTKEGFFKRLKNLFFSKTKVDDSFFDELEEILLSGDVGIKTTTKIIQDIKDYFYRHKLVSNEEMLNAVEKIICDLIIDYPDIKDFSFVDLHKPYVIMVVGINGVGKTTTIAKLAYQFKKLGKKVLIGAGDTFRAAAIEQLKIWSEKIDVPLISHKQGADPGAVAFDTINSALKKNFDVVIIDTAGRLHNKINLMNELAKIKKVIQKVLPEAPHETLLILDATTGQNAFNQTKQFLEIVKINSICITKLDGTAKGGVVIGVSHEFSLPIKYIGVGESLDDILIFDKQSFVKSLFS